MANRRNATAEREAIIDTQAPQVRNTWRDRLDLGAYTTTEAAWLAETTRQMVANWWRVAYAREGDRKPSSVGQPIILSYLQLIETALATTLRAQGISFADLALVHRQLRQHLRTQTPFASEKMRESWSPVGQERSSPLRQYLAANLPAAVWDHWRKTPHERLAQFEYDERFVRRWYPRGRDAILVVDPQLAFGAPIIAGTAVPIHIVEERFAAGETEAEIADDFGIDRRQIAAALELRRPKKRRVA